MTSVPPFPIFLSAFGTPLKSAFVTQDPSDPDHPEFSILGYKFYAILVGTILSSLLIILYRFGLFAALT